MDDDIVLSGCVGTGVVVVVVIRVVVVIGCC